MPPSPRIKELLHRTQYLEQVVKELTDEIDRIRDLWDESKEINKVSVQLNRNLRDYIINRIETGELV